MQGAFWHRQNQYQSLVPLLLACLNKASKKNASEHVDFVHKAAIKP